MRVLRLVAILLLPNLLFAESIHSRNNNLYSYYKPTKKIFIKKAKENYLFNSELEKAYADPMSTPKSALIYAVAMDYVYEDGSEKIKKAYELAAYGILGTNGYLAAQQYMDFLIRTKRYFEVFKINPKICGRDEVQCIYYHVVAKHFTNKAISKEECADAMKFSPMQKITISICE